MTKPHRDTIFVEDAEILFHEAWEGDQYVMRLKAPECAARAKPGSFVHLQCDPELPMRRPLSLMRASAEDGWVDILYKALGHGTRQLAKRQVGETVNILGPIGTPFSVDPERPLALLIGGGVGIPPMIFLADAMQHQHKGIQPLVIMGSEVPFPFNAEPSRFVVPGMPDGVIAAMPLLEEWAVPSRLTSLQGYPGCHEGYVTDLARAWLEALPEDQRNKVSMYSCGPHPMLEAVARLAAEFDIPCQVSLEEFMACAVGGCAGCTVKVMTDQGPAMKRVCVDGPVFEAQSVFGQA